MGRALFCVKKTMMGRRNITARIRKLCEHEKGGWEGRRKGREERMEGEAYEMERVEENYEVEKKA